MEIIDATDNVLGRLSTYISKKLLEGEEITVVNVEKAVVTGNKTSVLNEYNDMRKLTHKRKGPYYPRMPDRIFKRTVRGMLPYQRPRGRAAFKNLKVFIGVPSEMESTEFIKVQKAMNRSANFIYLGDISKHLGGKLKEDRRI